MKTFLIICVAAVALGEDSKRKNREGRGAEKRGVAGLGYGGWSPVGGPVGPWAGFPVGPEVVGPFPGGPWLGSYPGSLGHPELSLTKGSAHTIALQSATAAHAAEVAGALAAAKEASAAAALAQQRVQAAKEAVLVHQKIAAAKEAAAAAAIQRSEAAAATAAAIQRSEAAAAAIHRQEAAAEAAAAIQRSEAAVQAAAAIQRSQFAAHQIQKSAVKAAAANVALNHAIPYGKHIDFPWG